MLIASARESIRTLTSLRRSFESAVFVYSTRISFRSQASTVTEPLTLDKLTLPFGVSGYVRSKCSVSSARLYTAGFAESRTGLRLTGLPLELKARPARKMEYNQLINALRLNIGGCFSLFYEQDTV